MISVIGNFGSDYNMYCGQVQRTINIYNALSMNTKHNIQKVSTQSKSIINYLKIIKAIIFSSSIVILPGPKSLHQTLKILSLLGKLEKTNYVVIGGWLPDYLERNPTDILLLNQLASVHVQTEGMVAKLTNLGMNKVYWLPNFRIYEKKFDIPLKRNYSNSLKFVYYARITETKGIRLLVSAFIALNKEKPNTELYIYGPVEPDCEELIKTISKSDGKIKFKGILRDYTRETLSEYDVLVFPTHYDGEGFPGTILEGILSGLPIIASDWKYNKELIDKYHVGLMHDPFSADDLMMKMKSIVDDVHLLEVFRNNCIEATQKLNSNAIINTFISNLYLK